MKRRGILNHRIMDTIARMGHGDLLVVADAGLPIPAEVERIDIALIRGVPDFLTVLDAVLDELVVEEVVLAQEMSAVSPELEDKVRQRISQPITRIAHEEFKQLTKKAIAVIRTGECTSYANIILKSGVNFREV
ncbi:MAG: D-ribose pyranase [Bacillota bacterium]|uniref:D-ribose pyranase n=1 Tax=Thermanaerosceptrum fracticalcis TaxID=1712410 RepID=A0A7G6E5E9_THEFR|nr:D-ribose pyranase [Thermanaerosceptrum fracticalcis]QNB47303.1 D-ribose pyranase [Thermanaerosceptrum fracticalcis]